MLSNDFVLQSFGLRYCGILTAAGCTRPLEYHTFVVRFLICLNLNTAENSQSLNVARNKCSTNSAEEIYIKKQQTVTVYEFIESCVALGVIKKCTKFQPWAISFSSGICKQKLAGNITHCMALVIIVLRLSATLALRQSTSKERKVDAKNRKTTRCLYLGINSATLTLRQST